jgi:hypothetical protein
MPVLRDTVAFAATRHIASHQSAEMTIMQPTRQQRPRINAVLALMLVLANVFFVCCVVGYPGQAARTDWSRLESQPARMALANY